MPHRPLAVGVQQVVSQDVDAARLDGHVACQHHEVGDQVVRGDVVGPDRGVVGGPTPVLPA